LLQLLRRNRDLLSALLVTAFVCAAIALDRPAWIIALSLALGGGVLLYWAGFARRWFFWAVFFCIPLSVPGSLGGGFDMSLPSEPLLLLSTFFLFLLLLQKNISAAFLTHPISLLLFLELLIFLLTSLSSTMPEVSLKRTVSRTLYVLIFYVLTGHVFSELRQVPRLFAAYATALSIVIVYTLVQHAEDGLGSKVSFLISRPFYADHTVYGAAIAFVIPMIVVLLRHADTFKLSVLARTLLAPVGVLLFLGVFFSYSRAAWLSLILAGVFALLLRVHIRISHIMIGLLLSAAIVYVSWDTLYTVLQQTEAVSSKGGAVEQLQSVSNLRSDASNLERVNRWSCAWRMFKEKPLTGFGPGTYQFEYGRFQNAQEMTYISTRHGDRGNAHSEYLTYLSESGIAGLLTNLLIVFSVISLGLRLVYSKLPRPTRLLAAALLLGLTTFYVHGLVNMFIDQDKMAGLVFTAIAGLVAIDVFHNSAASRQHG